MYKTLAFCQQPHEFTEVEDFIAQTDEFVYSHIMQTPFAMIQMLVDAGGLAQTPLDSEGSPIADKQLANLSEDEADDLISTYRIQTTDAGVETVRLLAPERRIEAQLSLRPHRRDTYFAVLDFCMQPRKFPEIEALFKTTFPACRKTSWPTITSFRPTSTSTSSTKPARSYGAAPGSQPTRASACCKPTSASRRLHNRIRRRSGRLRACWELPLVCQSARGSLREQGTEVCSRMRFAFTRWGQREHTSVPCSPPFTFPPEKQYGSRRNPLPIAIDEFARIKRRRKLCLRL